MSSDDSNAGDIATPATDARATRSGISPEREMRIERIADIMRDGEWIRGRSGKELAKELGLSVDIIKHDAAIASKRVYAEVMQDRESIGAQVGTSLSKALNGALKDSNWKAVAALAKVYADASGVTAPQKIDATLSEGNTQEKAREIMKELFVGVAPAGHAPKPET